MTEPGGGGTPAPAERADGSLTPAARLARVYEVLADTHPVFADSDDPWMANGLSSTPYRALVSACLSTVTTTSRVVPAALSLFERSSSFEELATMDDDVLREAIRSVAHDNRKTQHLKRMSQLIVEQHGGEVPSERDQLMALPGVGRKVTDLILNFEFGQLTVGVDTHVHRLVNRLGVVSTRTHQQTADALAELTRDEDAVHAHERLVQHGMKVCTARSPHCRDCPLTGLCDHVTTR